MNKNIWINLFLLFLVVFALSVSAQTYEETYSALNQSHIDLAFMIDSGFNYVRINDTLTGAEQLFSAQIALMDAGGTPDFSLVMDMAYEISEFRSEAEEMNDELHALSLRLDEIADSGVGSDAFEILEDARSEFFDERYSQSRTLVDSAYAKISEEQALETRVRAIYESGTRNIVHFFTSNWKEIISIFGLILLVYSFTHRKVAVMIVDRKIANLEFEREILKSLIKKAQYEYFHMFKIPEELYHIKISKYGDLIRDIDRRVPILIEEKERIKGNLVEDNKKKINHVLSTVFVTLSVLFVFVFVFFDRIKEATLAFISVVGILVLIWILVLSSLLGVMLFIVKKKGFVLKDTKFYSWLKVFVSVRSEKVSVYFEILSQRLKAKQEYDKLLAMKKKEDLSRKRHSASQRMALIKINVLSKLRFRIKSVLVMVSFLLLIVIVYFLICFEFVPATFFLDISLTLYSYLIWFASFFFIDIWIVFLVLSLVLIIRHRLKKRPLLITSPKIISMQNQLVNYSDKLLVFVLCHLKAIFVIVLILILLVFCIYYLF